MIDGPAAVLLDYLVVAGSVAGALAAIYAGATTLFNLTKSVRDYRQDGTWEFKEATRQRMRIVRELRAIRENLSDPGDKL